MLVAFAGCKTFNGSKSEKTKIDKISIASAVPYYDQRINGMRSNRDTIALYYIGDNIVIQKCHFHGIFVEEEIDSFNSNLTMTGEKYLSSFFIYNPRSRYGSYSDSTGKGKMLLVDSFLQKNILQYSFPRNFKQILKLVAATKIDSQVQETYVSVNNNPISLKKDSVYLKFDKTYLNINFSISPFLDSLYKSKLCDMRFIIDPYYDSKIKSVIPRTEIYIQMEKQAITEGEVEFLKKLIENSNVSLRP